VTRRPGKWLDTNGESIYSTRPLTNRWNDTATPTARFTRPKDDNTTIYATDLSMNGPMPSSISLACVSVKKDGAVSLLGYIDDNTREAIPLSFSDDGTHLNITVPAAAATAGLLGPGYVFKLHGASERKC